MSKVINDIFWRQIIFGKDSKENNTEEGLRLICEKQILECSKVFENNPEMKDLFLKSSKNIIDKNYE
jgi:hypothetical protein